MSGFHRYDIRVFAAVFWIANSFAASDPSSSGEVPKSPEAAQLGTSPTTIKPDGAIPDHLQLLAIAGQANEELFSNLQSFVCDEQIRRFKGRITGEGSRQIDTVTAKVSFENGAEHYDQIRQNDHQLATISSLPGAWSTGEFGTLLRQTVDLLKGLPVQFRTEADLSGTPANLYDVEISEQDSPWDLEVRANHYRIPFRTKVWVSKATGQILKLERISTSAPRQIGISEIRWAVTLEPVKLNGKTWLLPKTGSYVVLYEESGRREWNEMSFSNYHRYGAEVALRFE